MSSATREQTHRALTAPPFRFNRIQAHHVLDMTVGRFSAEAKEQLKLEAEALRDAKRIGDEPALRLE